MSFKLHYRWSFYIYIGRNWNDMRSSQWEHEIHKLFLDGLMYQWATQWVINFIQIVFMWKFMIAEYRLSAMKFLMYSWVKSEHHVLLFDAAGVFVQLRIDFRFFKPCRCLFAFSSAWSILNWPYILNEKLVQLRGVYQIIWISKYRYIGCSLTHSSGLVLQLDYYNIYL